jgi:deazaflavin-dependent oxidoreductase (nitroreductase family)
MSLDSCRDSVLVSEKSQQGEIVMNTSLERIPNHENAKPPAFMIPILKLPLLLYRAGLGWLLGHRFMLLTHIGRRSGKVRQTVLAVLDFDSKTREIMTVSAWSASDWYKNIQSVPALQVQTGFTRYAPVQHSLSSEEIATLFENYCHKHPIFSRIVCRIPGWKWDSSHQEFLELAKTLRGVAFQPKENETA